LRGRCSRDGPARGGLGARPMALVPPALRAEALSFLLPCRGGLGARPEALSSPAVRRR